MFAKIMDWKSRIYAASAHLGGTLVVATLSYTAIIYYWFPYPFHRMMGGDDLFKLLLCVDIVLGPCLTILVFNTSKGSRQLLFDIGAIVLVQIAALCYGLHAAYAARPVAIVFEVDRFRVVTASDVKLEELPLAQAKWRSLPNSGVWVLGTRSSSSSEILTSVEMALDGFDIAQRPSYWQEYDLSRKDAIARSLQLLPVYQRLGYDDRAAVDETIAKAGMCLENAKYLPVFSRFRPWIVVLSKDGDLLHYINVNT